MYYRARFYSSGAQQARAGADMRGAEPDVPGCPLHRLLQLRCGNAVCAGVSSGGYVPCDRMVVCVPERIEREHILAVGGDTVTRRLLRSKRKKRAFRDQASCACMCACLFTADFLEALLVMACCDPVAWQALPRGLLAIATEARQLARDACEVVTRSGAPGGARQCHPPAGSGSRLLCSRVPPVRDTSSAGHV